MLINNTKPKVLKLHASTKNKCEINVSINHNAKQRGEKGEADFPFFCVKANADMSSRVKKSLVCCILAKKSFGKWMESGL